MRGVNDYEKNDDWINRIGDRIDWWSMDVPRPLKEFVMETFDCIGVEGDSGLGKKEFHGKDIDFEKLDKLINTYIISD